MTIMCPSFLNLEDRALLLGAIYGDGHIEQRSKNGQKVCVGSSDKYPEWLDEIRGLFDRVFGRRFESQKKLKGSYRFFENYVTTHDLRGIFGITAKYDSQHRLVPPAWIDAEPELKRLFIRGLVETDGCFTSVTDNRHNGEWAKFYFSQKCPYLMDWVTVALRQRGYNVIVQDMSRGTLQAQVGRQEHVKDLGEWLQSVKWKTLLDAGFQPTLVRRVAVKPPVYAKTIPMADQEEWRRLRVAGASIIAIARHYGRGNNVVHQVVRDIQPEKATTGFELGLVARPRYPKESSAPRGEVEQWRVHLRDGKSAAWVATQFGRQPSMVIEATCDIINGGEVEAT